MVTPLLLALAFGASPEGIDFDGGIRFVASDVPREVDLDSRLHVAIDFDAATVNPGTNVFLHLESGGDCRIVGDAPLPQPVDGHVRVEIDMFVPNACDAGTQLTLWIGLWTPADGKRMATHPSQVEDRVDAGHLVVVAEGADLTPVHWDLAKLRLEGKLGASRPPWPLAAGFLLLLAALAMARKTRLMRAIQADQPKLYARLDPLWLTERVLTLAVIVWSALYVVQFLDIALQTLSYPYPLEWMEPGIVETVQRIRDGQSIYGPPTIEYVPYIYTPGYPAVVSAVSLFTGVDFFAARLVSFVSILGVAVLIYRFVQRETRSHLWAFVGVGLLFATFNFSGRWFHLARVDSLNLLLLLWPLYLLRFRTTMRSAVVAGLLMTACFLTKQGAPIAFLPPVGLLFFFDAEIRKRAFVSGAVFVVTSVAFYLVAQAMTDGWFKYYVFDVPSRHDIVQAHYRIFWSRDLWAAAPLMAITVLGLAFMAVRQGKRVLVYAGLGVGFLAVAWLSRLHNGGYANVLIPGFGALALLAPLGLAELEKSLAESTPKNLGVAPARIGIAVLVLLQLFGSKYASGPSLPAPNARENAEKFLDYVAKIDGDVLLPDWDFIERRIGKTSYSQGMAARDLVRVPGADPGKDVLLADINRAFAERRFGAVILSEEGHLRNELIGNYCFKEKIDLAPEPVTGWGIRPQWVWVPRPPDMKPGAVNCPRRATPRAPR